MNSNASTTAETQAGPHRGPSALLVWAPILVAVASLWPTFLALSHRWNVDAGGSHGWLIGPVCLWLIWLAHKDYRNVDYRPSLLAAVLLVGAVLVTLVLRLASIESLEYLAAIGVVWLAAVTVLGWRWGWLLAFPVGFMVFSLPLWEETIPLLQRMTSSAVGMLVQATDMRAYVRGDFVDVPSGTFHIEGGCSGSHYFVTAMALTALYCHLHYQSWRPRLALVAAMVALSVVGNWVRVFMVVYAGYVTDMQHPWVKDHYTLGWIIFGVTLIPFFLIGRWLERFDLVRRADQTVVPNPVAGGRDRAVSATAGLVLACALVVAPPLAVYALTVADSGAGNLELPPPTGAWAGPNPVASTLVFWHPGFHGATTEAQASYASDSDSVEVYLNWYTRQRQGAELIGYGSAPEGHGYERLAERQVESGSAKWRLIQARRGDDLRLVAVRYRVGGRAAANALQAKLWQGLGGLVGRTGGGVIAVSVPCTPDCATAEPTLMQFLNDMNDSLDAALDRAAQGNGTKG